MNKIRQKLQELKDAKKEDDLFPYLQQLFRKKGYLKVEITHGKDEFGKDLVFAEYDDKKKKEKWTSIVVKNKDASMQDFEEKGEITRQILLSFQHPFKSSTGKEYLISEVTVVINGSVGTQAKSVLEKVLSPHFLTNVDIWNYQRLEEEITEHIKEDFLSDYEVAFNNYRMAQIALLAKVDNTKELFHGLTINDINDIYVSAKTSYSAYKSKKDNYLTFEGDKKKAVRNEELDEAVTILKDNKDFFIYGLPTSGKSLLLKRIGIKALEEEHNKPIAVFYWELSKIKSIQSFNIWDETYQQYEKAAQEKLDFDKFSKVVILFDALDELRIEEAKVCLLKKILAFKLEYQQKFEDIKKEKESKLIALLSQLNEQPKEEIAKVKILNEINDLEAFTKKKVLQIIVTSRDQKVVEENELLTKFEKIELLPFDIGQALKLVKKIIPNSNSKSNSFVKAIKDSMLTNKLVRTPLALTLMAILYKEDQVDLAELPANITELYNKFTDFYLERWDSSKGISAQYKYEEARQILAMIASHMHTLGLKFITEHDLSNFLIQLKNSYDFKDLSDIPRFISSLQERPGLFQFDEFERKFYFYHLTFQEYFSSISFNDSNEEMLKDNFYEEWWENTLVFYCGKQPTRDVFIKTLFEKKIPVGAFQHYRYFTVLSKCLQANHLISRGLKKEIVKSLIFQFNKFVSTIIEKDKENSTGATYALSTLDFIMQSRDFFINQLNSKHLNSEDLHEVYNEIVLNSTNSDILDITKYSLSYLLSQKLKDSDFLAEFARQKDLNVRWARIVYIDLKLLHLEKSIKQKIMSKIEKKQRENKDYIKEQFGGSAANYLLDKGEITSTTIAE